MSSNDSSLIEAFMEMLQSSSSGSRVSTAEQVAYMRNTLVPEIRDNVLYMSATTLSPDFKWTLVYGVLCNGYGAAEFEVDVQAVARRYRVPESHLLRYAIKGTDKVPDKDAAYRDMVKIIRKLNNANCTEQTEQTDDTDEDAPQASAALQANVAVDPVQRLRIYEVGIKETKLMTGVFKYMLKQWNSERKSVQFIHSGGKKYIMEFWKQACLKKLCTDVQYVLRDDYTVFGMLD